MWFYFAIFALLGICSFIEIFGLRRSDTLKLYTLWCLFFFALSFLRWEVGTDWVTYYAYFEDITVWGQHSEFEWGFSRLNEFAKIVFGNYTVLLFILGAILFSFQSAGIARFSPYPLTSLFFLWAVSFGNAMFVRQIISVVILFYSVRYIQERRLWMFLLMIGLAMLFHRTSIIFIFAWWVYGMKWRPLTLIVWILVSMSLTAVIDTVFTSMGTLMGGVVQSKIDVYTGNSEQTFGAKASLAQIIIKGFANKIVVFGIALLMLARIKTQEPEFRGYLNLYWMGIILYFSTISISVALVRLSFPFDMFQIIIIPFVLKYLPDRNWKLFGFIVFLLYLALRLYVALTTNYYDLFVPFKTIFSK